MSKIKLLWMLPVLAVIGGMVWYATRPQPISVQLSKVVRGTVEATVTNTRAGSVKACRRAKLAPPIGGQIVQLKVKKGERVKAGQILLELWNDDLQAQARLAQLQLRTAQTKVGEICSMAELSQKELERARQLHQKEYISTEQLERAAAEAQSRQSSCLAVRSEIGQGQSRIAYAEAGLRRMMLKAPFDGVVADISGELGEYTTPSPPGVATPAAIDLIDDSCMYVSAPIDEVDAAKIQIGQNSRITLDAIKGKTFTGKVKRIAPYVLELEKQARTVEVEVAFDEPATSLLIGYSADVEIVYQQRENVLRIPSQAILEGKKTLRYGPEGLLEEQIVSTGLSNWEQSEIISGLSEGDQIVLSLDKAGLKPGVRVQPEK